MRSRASEFALVGMGHVDRFTQIPIDSSTTGQRTDKEEL
ncbi:hypothetical protein EV191_109225 [Tamaricihabitans halophyticus]|uniref:Uncharacterized protein n=1 Tax=Tamaricihabitans halophyticus TaxID=1262583 RepID=A0A4R2QJ49_9PSEU|nr:hypothetical protein EV191_109225 [Tamaricihabitans halophyticus]